MLRQKMVWSALFVVSALALTAAGPAQAGLITDGLQVWLDAADADGDGVAGAGSGTAWVNKGSLGTDYNGTLAATDANLPSWAGSSVSGANPYRIQFNGTSNYAQVPSATGGPLNYNGTAFTIEVWASQTTGGSDQALVSHNTSGAGSGNYVLHDKGDGTMGAFGGQGSEWAPLPNSSGALTSTIKQFVITHAANGGNGYGVTNFYINGVNEGTGQMSSNSSDSAVLIGCNGYGASSRYAFLNGAVSDCRIYNTVLADADVLQNFNAEATRFIPEPGTLILLGTGLLGLLAYAWRRRR